ncbi:MAG: hypothetical protein H0X51_09230 [Parachlamydiaceae bacterium]|nr:hypothetical protein [Parachlamydiaceae bacterium]
MQKKSTENFVWGALLGGVIAAAAALLLTPFSGLKLRRQIQSRLGMGKTTRSHSVASNGTHPPKAKKTIKRAPHPHHTAKTTRRTKSVK